MNDVKPEDRCSIPEDVLRSMIKHELEILRRRGLIQSPPSNPFDEQKDTE